MNQADKNTADLTVAPENQAKPAFQRATDASEELKAAIQTEALVSSMSGGSSRYPSWH